ncbi:MAG: zinc ribbon domain-containing protein [Anaerolineae bacterium]|nr:zinc ribbon domain-containing protein [Anaerolineae bacterium]
MECPKCGFENRADARFCKQCGQALEVLPTLPPAGVVCPACGATAKPQARFCPRCGKALVTLPTPTPEEVPVLTTQPSMPVPPASQTMPSMPKPARAAAPPASPPLPPPPPKRRFPRWIGWVGGFALFLCLVAAIVAAAIFLLPLVRGEETATPTPSAVDVTGVPTVTVTPAPPTQTSTPQLVQVFAAELTIAAVPPEVAVGERVTLTVTLTNTGEAMLGLPRYLLVGEWEPVLALATDAGVGHDRAIFPGESDTVVYVLEAMQPGQVVVWATATMEAHEPPRWESSTSEAITIVVVE